MSRKRVLRDSDSTSSTSTTCHDVDDVEIATTTHRRHVAVTSSSCKKNTSCQHYWQNDDSVSRNRLKIQWFQYKTTYMRAEIVGLFILLTPLNDMHSTTCKAEERLISTWNIATYARDHDSLTTWMDVHAWTNGIMCPSDALRDIGVRWERWMTLCHICLG